MENDNTIYVKLKRLSDSFKACNVGLSFPVINPTAASLGFMYFSAAPALEELIDYINSVYQMGKVKMKKLIPSGYVNDMSIS
jgi:hypothetical protein